MYRGKTIIIILTTVIALSLSACGKEELKPEATEHVKATVKKYVVSESVMPKLPQNMPVISQSYSNISQDTMFFQTMK